MRFEQEFPIELEDSFYWLLSNLEIHRFSFEHDPNENATQTLFVWLPLNEWSVREQETLEKALISLAKTFELSLPPCKWIQVKDEDWSLSWKKSWEPDPVGKSIFFLGIFASISSIEPRKTFKRFAEKSFKAALILVADIAKESVSTEKVLFAPNLNAARDSIPLPQPISAITWPTGG